jgi:hypothetical protein
LYYVQAVKLHTQWVLGALSLGENGQSMKLCTELRLVLILLGMLKHM